MSGGALLQTHPLSDTARLEKERYPDVARCDMTYRRMRDLCKILVQKPAHSFETKGGWHSLSPQCLATFYEDEALHAVGAIRAVSYTHLTLPTIYSV